MVREQKKTQSIQQFSSVIFFVTIAALLWLLIKLSANYTITEPLTINLKDAPSEYVILDGSQTINITISSTGFELLNYYFRPLSRRKVDISLEEVPLHKDGESTYSFGVSYIKEKIANLLTIEPNQITFDDNKINIKMELLDSKRVKVHPNIDISYDKQFNRHGKIKISPDSVTIYGPKNILSEIDNIYTDNITLKNVNSNINIDVPLHLESMINSDTENINIRVNVEKYTEAIANVAIKNNTNLNLRLFPDKIKIRYIVSLTDYNIINENSFELTVDSIDIMSGSNFLPIYLADYPNNTRIISIEPKEVEYIIIGRNDN